MAGGKGKAGKDSGKAKSKVISRSQRAGLQFPVGRIHRFLKQKTTSSGRVGATAAVYRYLSVPLLALFTLGDPSGRVSKKGGGASWQRTHSVLSSAENRPNIKFKVENLLNLKY